jgi:hypothetical protein
MLATSVIDEVSCEESGGGAASAAAAAPTAVAGSNRTAAAAAAELLAAFALLGALPLTVLSAVAASGGVDTRAVDGLSTAAAALITPCPLDIAVP